MPTEVIMPALGMSQETGRLIAWLKNEGDFVQKGDLIMEVETDKTTVEIEAQSSGTLVSFRAVEGDEVPVGEVIALIAAAGEEIPATEELTDTTINKTELSPASKEISRKLLTPVAARMAAVHDIEDVHAIPAKGNRVNRADVEAYLDNRDNAAQSLPVLDGRVLASPKSRRLANERGIDLASITGSGPEGAVLAGDVLMYSPPESVVIAPVDDPVVLDDKVQTGKMWQRMAERLTESWQTIPHFYLKREVNASRLVSWHQGLKTRSNVKISLTDLLVKAVSAALRQHPFVNGRWNGTGVVFNEDVNVGLAVAVDKGLLVPVIHNADMLSVTSLAHRRAEIVERSVQGKLQPVDLQNGTFTISNLGMFGINEFDAIVNPPQVAILAVGNITERVIPQNGDFVVQPMMVLSLSCDHRAVDGAHGADFLRTLAGFIEDPITLMD